MEKQLEENYQNISIKRKALPLIPLRGKVAFPATTITFEAGREITLKAIERASATVDKYLFLCSQKDPAKTDVIDEDLYTVGTVAVIRQVVKTTGAIRVVCEGLYRAKWEYIREIDGCKVAYTEEVSAIEGDPVMQEAYVRTARALLKEITAEDGKFPKESLEKINLSKDADEFVNLLLSVMRVRLEIKQQILETRETVKRLQLLDRCLNDELEISRVERKIATTVRKNIDKSQKDFFLREQLRAIHTELGDDGKEEDEYREKIKAKNLPKELEEKALKEVDRMEKMQPTSPEYTVITGYLDQVLELPWTEQTDDTEKLADCIKVLDEDHYGLEKVKERITEYLAVLKLTGSMNAPILCLVGPPGVGKTSIAQS